MIRLFHTIVGEFRDLNASDKQLRKFGLMIGIILVVIFSIVPLVIGKNIHVGASLLGMAFIALSTILPRILTPLYYVWMGIAIVLGAIVSPLFLGILFFIFLTPIGLMKRLFSRTPVKKGESYWIPRVGSQDPKRMEELF